MVSVFISGRPLWVNPELNASDAFVVAWLPGSEGGGVADVLFRAADGSVRHDFTGKLSFSWPKLPTQVVLNRNDPEYDPLFAYGYGLTSGDEIEVAELSEETGDLPTLSRTVYFEDGPVFPWQLFVGDPVDWRVRADGSVTTTRNSDNLVVKVVDREGQGDARAVRWSGAGMAAVYVQASDPIDLSRESNGEMAISFDGYLEEAPGGAVVLRVDGGEDLTRGMVDVTAMVKELPLGEWGSVAVRLRCFEDAGADMKKIYIPFGLSTEGSLALRFADVKLVSAAESEATCP
jgi:beta-glucosidase